MKQDEAGGVGVEVMFLLMTLETDVMEDVSVAHLV